MLCSMILCCWRKSCVLRSRREIRQCTASVTFTYASVKAWENLNETACYRRNPASYLKLKHAGQMVIVVAVTESVFQRCKQFHINWSKNFESKFQSFKHWNFALTNIYRESVAFRYWTNYTTYTFVGIFAPLFSFK